MNGVHVFSFSGLPVSQWRNGGGETREIISWPMQKAEFLWRASIATIAQSGPFSAFPGIDRSITLLSGEGVNLQSSDGSINHALTTSGQPFYFSGDCALSASLLGGLTTDFNIMTRRNHCCAEVSLQKNRAIAGGGLGGVLYVLQGQWELEGLPELSPGEGLWWANDVVSTDDSSALILTSLQPQSLLLWAEIFVSGNPFTLRSRP